MPSEARAEGVARLALSELLTNSPWRLSRKRIFILPTRLGLTLAIVIATVLVGATNYNNSLAFLLAFLLLSVALVSMLHTYRDLAGLTVQLHGAQSVFAGDMARFRITLDNNDGPQRLGVILRTGRRDDTVKVSVALGENDITECLLPVHSTQRGWLRLDRVCVASRAPIGVFRAWSWVPGVARALVFPRPLGDQPLPLCGPAGNGPHTQRIQGDEEFVGLKPYRPGDSPRRIHWRAAARSEWPPVKQFDASVGTEIELRFDNVLASEPEARISQLTAWVLQASQMQMGFALDLPGQRIEAGHGEAHREHCLRTLALWNLSDATPA